VKKWNKSKNLFQSSDLPTKNICISAYQISSCCTSRGREIFTCYWKLGDDALHM